MSESTLSTTATSDELSKAIKDSINPDDIRAALIAEAEKQQKSATDQAAADAAAKEAADVAAKAAADAEAAKTPTKFSRTETIGGKEFVFEGDSELDVERQVTQAFKVASALYQEPAPVVVDPAKEAADKAAAEAARAAERTELELKFKRGEISTTEYLEQSGAVKDYLEKQGVPLDELKASIEKNRSTGFEQSWAEATETFLKTAAGQDWPGGDQNRELIGLKIAALGLVESEDKVAALAQAWNSMKQSQMFFPVKTAAVEKTDAEKQAEAKAAADAAAAKITVPATTAPAATTTPAAKTSSSLFGASSGFGGAAGSAEAKVKDKVEIAKDASPAEILQAWKEGQIRDGKDPNSAFIDTFAAKRA